VLWNDDDEDDDEDGNGYDNENDDEMVGFILASVRRGAARRLALLVAVEMPMRRAIMVNNNNGMNAMRVHSEA
jgi:hypothetical protein